MKTINIYFDFEFTSLSTDAQPISLGIVSETVHKNDFREIDFGCTWEELQKLPKPSFYAEFSDFDLNRCDDWVKENVVSKLMTNSVANKLGISFENAKDAAKTSTNWSREYCILKSTDSEISLVGNTWRIKEELKKWLEQFSDYNIQFVCDCGTFDWYWMLQLLAEWDVKIFKQKTKELHEILGSESMAFGLPKLPSNISPVPQDLNDLIAHKKGISVREAFELDREDLAYGWIKAKSMEHEGFDTFHQTENGIQPSQKYNALWDAKVIKAIYEKLK